MSIEHYLALIDGGSHLYELPELEGADLSLANGLASPDIPLTDSYLKALSLGFMQATVAQNPSYQDVLDNQAIVQVGQQPLPLFVISTLTEDMLQPSATEATEDIESDTEATQEGTSEDSPVVPSE